MLRIRNTDKQRATRNSQNRFGFWKGFSLPGWIISTETIIPSHPPDMKILHLVLIAFFLILMATPGISPDSPWNPESCHEKGGFCYAKNCPWCFSSYGACDIEVTCCMKESWRPECEEATTPTDADNPTTSAFSTPKPTSPQKPPGKTRS